MNGNRATIVQMLIQGGSIGIALFALWLVFGYMTDIGSRSIEIQTSLIENVEQQTEALDDLTEVVRDWRRLSAPNVTLEND